MNSKNFIPLDYKTISSEESLKKSKAFYDAMEERRSIRHFSTQGVSRKVIENIIKTASTAPSGAHKQPWNFCAISNKVLKKKIRAAAEIEEKLNYEKRMSATWLKDLEPFETNWEKPMLEDAPWLIVIFMKTFDVKEEEKLKNYYVKESVGLAAGFLLTAIHQAGLCSLTHTPSPMKFLADVLERPSNEKAFLLIPVGYPTEDCQVPLLQRKNLAEVSIFFE